MEKQRVNVLMHLYLENWTKNRSDKFVRIVFESVFLVGVVPDQPLVTPHFNIQVYGYLSI